VNVWLIVCYVVTYNYYVCTHTCVPHGVHVYIFYLLSSTGTVGRLLITRVPGTTVPGIFFCARAPPAKIKFYKKELIIL